MADNTLSAEDRQKLERNLNELNEALAPLSSDAKGLEAGIDVCGVYCKAKPIIGNVLPLIKLIPIYGAKVAGAISALESVADHFCKCP